MSIVYSCRHCGNEVGRINQPVIDTETLGLDKLSTDDLKEMVLFKQNGDVQIKTICENCEASLGQNPHYHELDFFIQ
ncbi:anti-sigma-F factor Fin [Virgibacillus flavescens]|uniref:anti-sigma-F factor Fin n=1 Tax=Virgibacillus flavescens TaxID=1611422 RepID=UPI003D34F174